MNFLEVAVGKFVFFLGLLVFLIINTQVPFGVFVNSVRADELILLLRGRLMLAPRVPFVPYKFSFVHQFFGVCEGCFVQFHHDDSPPGRVCGSMLRPKSSISPTLGQGHTASTLRLGIFMGSGYSRMEPRKVLSENPRSSDDRADFKNLGN